jgi:hypothetical protein
MDFSQFGFQSIETSTLAVRFCIQNHSMVVFTCEHLFILNSRTMSRWHSKIAASIFRLSHFTQCHPLTSEVPSCSRYMHRHVRSGSGRSGPVTIGRRCWRPIINVFCTYMELKDSPINSSSYRDINSKSRWSWLLDRAFSCPKSNGKPSMTKRSHQTSVSSTDSHWNPQ